MLIDLANAKISTKLAVLGTIVIILFVALAAWAMFSLQVIRSGLQALDDQRHVVDVATKAQLGSKEIGVSVRDLFLAQTKDAAVNATEKTLGFLASVDARLITLNGLETNQTYRGRIDEIIGLWKKYGDLTKTVTETVGQKLDRREVFFQQGPVLTTSVANLAAEAEHDVTPGGLAAAKIVLRAQSALSARRIGIWRYLATYEESQLKDFQAAVGTFNDLMAELRTGGLAPTFKARLAELQRLSDEYNQTGTAVTEQARSANDVYFKQATQMRAKAGDLLDGLVTDLIDEQNALSVRLNATAVSVTRGLVIGGILVLVFLIVTLVMIGRTISRPVVELTELVRRVAEGDLEVADGGAVAVVRRDEVGMITASVAAMVAALRALVNELKTLTGEARAGNISARGDAPQLKGEFADLLHGTNDLLELLSRPLTDVAQVMQRLATGDLKGRVAGVYEGELRALKNNVNRSLDGLVSLLTELGTLAEGMAAGDLRRTLGREYQGEFASLKANFNQAVVKLRDTLARIIGNTTQVSSAVIQTSAAANQLATATARQMSTLGEISAAIGQTAIAVNEVSANASTGSSLARTSAALAADGLQMLIRLGGEVEQIAVRQGNIDRITTTITRIADKTHVLSINASIEAVGAGEQGRRFGVVAREIGRLAEEVASAARDIGGLIAEAGLDVQRTVAGVAEARQTVEQIAAAATSAELASTTIASAIAEQASTVRMLSDRSNELQEISASSAAAIEEISATMTDLARLADRTRAEMMQFATS